VLACCFAMHQLEKLVIRRVHARLMFTAGKALPLSHCCYL
jgi:hypothetical protein